MIKIAFLGSDSTHAEAFARLINNPEAPFYRMARVVSIWGENINESQQKAEALAIPRVCTSIDQALDGVDLAMIIGRFADSHFKAATCALKKCIPTFVDKPFMANSVEAKEIIRIAKINKTGFFSSSPLRFAPEVVELKDYVKQSCDFRQLLVCCPKNCIELGDDPRFENIFFYGIHAVEMLLEVLGHDIRSYDFYQNEKQTSIFIDFRKYSGTIHMIRDINEFYSLTSLATAHIKQVDIKLDGTYYTNLLKFALNDFLINGLTVPEESSLLAVSILEQIDSVK